MPRWLRKLDGQTAEGHRGDVDRHGASVGERARQIRGVAKRESLADVASGPHGGPHGWSGLLANCRAVVSGIEMFPVDPSPFEDHRRLDGPCCERRLCSQLERGRDALEERLQAWMSALLESTHPSVVAPLADVSDTQTGVGAAPRFSRTSSTLGADSSPEIRSTEGSKQPRWPHVLLRARSARQNTHTRTDSSSLRCSAPREGARSAVFGHWTVACLALTCPLGRAPLMHPQRRTALTTSKECCSKLLKIQCARQDSNLRPLASERRWPPFSTWGRRLACQVAPASTQHPRTRTAVRAAGRDAHVSSWF